MLPPPPSPAAGGGSKRASPSSSAVGGSKKPKLGTRASIPYITIECITQINLPPPQHAHPLVK